MFNFKRKEKETPDLRLLDFIRAENEELTDAKCIAYGKQAEEIMNTDLFKYFIKNALRNSARELLAIDTMTPEHINDVKLVYESILNIEKFFKDFEKKYKELTNNDIKQGKVELV